MDDFGPQFPVGAAFLAVAVLFGLAMAALQVFIFWRIFTRVGYSGAYGFLVLIPLVNLGMLLFLAFGEWPVLRELAGLRQRAGINDEREGFLR